MALLKLRKEIIFFVLIAIIIVMSYVNMTLAILPECSQVRYIESSLEVRSTGGKSFIGLNTDQDALKFGGISAGGSVIRSVEVINTKKSQAAVFMEGELAGWVEITPNKLELEENEPQSVFFKVSVPEYAFDGNYTGRVKFCFKE